MGVVLIHKQCGTADVLLVADPAAAPQASHHVQLLMTLQNLSLTASAHVRMLMTLLKLPLTVTTHGVHQSLL